MELGQEEHGGEIRHCGDGYEGGREGGEEGVGGAEAVLEVGGGCEEHIPACSCQTMGAGVGEQKGLPCP